MIELKHLGKIYSSASGSVEALKDVNLTIADGEIFGIIGLSGAGKSTLVRCINLLERPTSGEVWVDGQNHTALSQKELLQVRRQIGMIFQGFNLLEQRTVLRNVCFPLEISGTPKAQAKSRAEELLKIVGLADKASWESAGSKNEKGVFFLPNIPTEEVFTAPHKDKVDGIVYGTKPYVFNGQLIKGFHVTFKDGKVVEHGAEEGADLLGRLLDTDEGARHIGEVALVPASSPINRSGALFYSTLFDENAACHIAFGASYPGTTEGGTGLTKEQLEERGMNQSTIHEDVMIGAEDSHITGKCRDGRVVELFRNGVWVL